MEEGGERRNNRWCNFALPSSDSLSIHPNHKPACPDTATVETPVCSFLQLPLDRHC